MYPVTHVLSLCTTNPCTIPDYTAGIDLVHDEPEASIITEIDVTKRCQDMARGFLDSVKGQLSLNRAALHEMEKDNKDKHVASVIDSAAFNLKETSR